MHVRVRRALREPEAAQDHRRREHPLFVRGEQLGQRPAPLGDADHLDVFRQLVLGETPTPGPMDVNRAVPADLDGFAFRGPALDRADMLRWMFFEQYSHEPYVAVARFIAKFLPADHPRRAELPRLQERAHQALAVMERELATRDFMASLRDAGVQTEGPRP